MGKLRFYLMTGIAGFVFTFIFSIRNNLWMTSMYRALLACVIWFLLAFLLNWMFLCHYGSASRCSRDVDTRGARPRNCS